MLGATFSLEATKPSAAELNELGALLKKSTPLYLSAIPGQSFEQHADLAVAVRKAGLEPVVHLPARRFASIDELGRLLARLRTEADLKSALVIAGDGPQQGPFADALALIRSGALQKAGVTQLGISGYPEGHSQLPAEKIEAALRDKIAEAEKSGLKLWIVSQFSFDPDEIVGWLKRLRAQGVRLPVRVGMAGPTSIPALLRYAKRCGVRASMHGLVSGAAAALLGNVGPDKIIEALRRTGPDVGEIVPHYFSFGGVVQTARYARETERAESAPRQAAS